jgi:integrase
MRKSRVTVLHRRALSREEVPWLLQAARSGEAARNKRWSGTGEDRYLVYLVELNTGLRATALGRLRVRDFRLDDRVPCVRIPSHLEKNRTENNIPLPPQVVAELRKAFALNLPDAIALNCPRAGDTAWMVRHDLSVAKASYVKAGRSAKEKADRSDDGFLAIETEGRMPFDFHSLRVTTGTLLQEAGVPIGFVQRILNHKTLAMTLDNYNQPGLETLHKLVAAAPALSTGT